MLVRDLIELTYIQAFLQLTVNEKMPVKAAVEWLYFLADKYPESRLAVHVQYASSALEAEVD